MVRIRLFQREQHGVALLAVMIAIFILTIVVAAMAIATMGESQLSFDQYREQQALGIAEAGAYRALADLRRRLSVSTSTPRSAIPACRPPMYGISAVTLWIPAMPALGLRRASGSKCSRAMRTRRPW